MGKNNHILCIRLSAMGDVAMTVPVLIALSRKYPELKITVLSRPFFKPFFETIPNVTFHAALVTKNHKGLTGIYNLYKELKPLGFSAVADLHNVLRSKILDSLFKLKGVQVVQLDKGRKDKNALIASKDKSLKPLISTHQRYAQVFEKLGYPITLKSTDVLARKTWAPEVIDILGKEPQKWIGIAPFAAHTGKMYPLDLVEQVIKQLSETTTYKLILFGGGSKEKTILNNIASKYKNTINIVGKLSFDQELAIISRLDVMLSMDSGNAHLAAMYGVSVVTLWGVTHPSIGFASFAQAPENQLTSDREQYPLIPTSVYGNKVPTGYENVMRTIAPNQVINTIHAILK